MPPKKSKKTAAKKPVAKKAATKKPSAKKKAVKKAAAKKKAKPTTAIPVPPEVTGIPCICILNEEGWFCMTQLPNGELQECDGPFDTKKECEAHTCG